jgi:DhnA family fructose-bisphosphate aldolase class Ia
MKSSASVGKERRMRRLFSRESGKILVVPLDDSLLAGPTLGLENITKKLAAIMGDPPDAIIGFKGLFINHSDRLAQIAGILNITASTTRSQHTRKTLLGRVEEAVQLGLDGVAVHVNISSKYEHEMIGILGLAARDCESAGMPLVAHMYARSEGENGDNNYEELKRKDSANYAKLVAHAARVGVEAGANIIKTQYTGDPDSFQFVIDACTPIPVIIAGGPPVDAAQMLKMAFGAISAGASGISFGRNVFSRGDPRPFIAALKMIVHDGASDEMALNKHPEISDRERQNQANDEPKARQP